MELHTLNIKISRQILRYLIICCAVVFSVSAFGQEKKDSVVLLKKITVTAYKKPGSFNRTIPAQSLSAENLSMMNAGSIGEATKYFSGVLVKDYGGVGGLKTVSVRSLGASHTGVLYDGVPVADLQTGQIDLGKFTVDFIHSLELYQASPPQLLNPARTNAAAAVLVINSAIFSAPDFDKTSWTAGLKTGSFGLWQPYAGIQLPIKHSIILNANAEAVWSKGNYPFYIDNGSFSEKTNRENSDTRSFKGEINLLKLFSDSSSLQTKLRGYSSERGLPGSIVFFNDRSVQRLFDDEFFIQSRYRKNLDDLTSLLIIVKYNYLFTKYRDPDFLNDHGGIDDRYKQQEIYGSAAVSRKVGRDLAFSAASDVAVTGLQANKADFARPLRTSWWTSISGQYTRGLWKADASILNTFIHESTRSGNSAPDKNVLSPTLALSFRPGENSPWMFRAFYKSVFRAPTFNDLYYVITGNVSLRPEYAKQYNTGIAYTKKMEHFIRSLNFSLDAYFNTVKDKIIAVPSKNLFIWTMLNIGKVQTRGLDITIESEGDFSRHAGWFFRSAYTYQRALDVSDPKSATYKNTIPYTPDHSGSAIVGAHMDNWTAGYSVLFSGNRFTLGDNNDFNSIPGWITQDFYLSRSFKTSISNIDLKAGINNIFNNRYDVIRYYPMPGRSYSITISFNHS